MRASWPLRHNLWLFVGVSLPQTGKGHLNSLVYFEAVWAKGADGMNTTLKLLSFYAISGHQREKFT